MVDSLIKRDSFIELWGTVYPIVVGAAAIVLHNKARVGVTADYSHYPPTIIRIQTITESGAFGSPCTTNILNDVGLARDTGTDYQHSLGRYRRHFV